MSVVTVHKTNEWPWSLKFAILRYEYGIDVNLIDFKSLMRKERGLQPAENSEREPYLS